VAQARMISKVHHLKKIVLATMGMIALLPAPLFSETFQKTIAIDQSPVELPMEAYEQRALAHLQAEILKDHIQYEYQWPDEIHLAHKSWLAPEVRKSFNANLDVRGILLENRKKSDSQYLFNYSYIVTEKKTYTASPQRILSVVKQLAGEKDLPAYVRLELELGYPFLRSGQLWSGWTSQFKGYSAQALTNQPIDEYKMIVSSATRLDEGALALQLPELFSLYDLAPFNADICQALHQKTEQKFPYLSEQIILHCPFVNLSTGDLLRKHEDKKISAKLIKEISRLKRKAGVVLDEVPLFAFMLAYHGEYPLALKQFNEMSFEDLLEDQGLVFSILNLEHNFSQQRLNKLQQEMKEEGYPVIANILERQAKLIS